MSTDDYEQAIATYRAQLRAGAELADGDLDEIEDHLRALTDDLRRRGVPAAEAVTEAARRLGEPRAIAREHSRVRSAFGARLSAGRTWSVVALLVPMMVYATVLRYPDMGLWNRFALEMGMELFLVGALVLRMGWARPILLAAASFGVFISICFVQLDGAPFWLAWNLGVFAFLVPWRKREMTPGGIALACYVWSYSAASWTLGFTVTSSDGIESFFPISGILACIAATCAVAGAILRARWSSMAGLVAAGALAVATYRILGLDFKFASPTLFQVAILGSLVTGVLAALVGSMVAWRTARSTLGSLHAIRS